MIRSNLIILNRYIPKFKLAMTTRYILFDRDAAKTKLWQRRLGLNHPIAIMTASVETVSADIYGSPANGYGQLDGGIDKIYRTLFPGIQKAVDTALLSYTGKKPLLGVGSALIVPVPNRATKLLLAPTMDLPSKLKTPWNAFWAALAIFYVTSGYSGTVAIPGLGTGTGHLDPDEMITMVSLAWQVSQKIPRTTVYPECDFEISSRLILPESMHERPIPESIRRLIAQ